MLNVKGWDYLLSQMSKSGHDSFHTQSLVTDNGCQVAAEPNQLGPWRARARTVIVSDSQTCEYLGHSPWSELPCVEPSSRDPRAGVGGGKGNPPAHPIGEVPNAPPLRSSSSNYVAIGT